VGVLLGMALRVGERRGDGWANPPEHERLAPVASALTTDGAGALAYAAWVLWWEAMPDVERERLKAERARVYQLQAMGTQAPTERQIGYLRSLGYRGPAPASKAEASALIDRWRAGGAR